MISCSLNVHSKHEKGAVIVSLLSAMLVIGLLLLFVVYGILGRVVPPNAIGVRQNFFSVWGLLSVGYNNKGLKPGLHWQIPQVSQVHLIPRDFQFINLGKDAQKGGLNLSPLEIPTADGSKVITDLTMLVRFFESPSDVAYKNNNSDLDKSSSNVNLVTVPFADHQTFKHGGPRDLINSYTLDTKKQLQIIATKAEDFIRRSLSSLSGNDYYNPVLRERLALESVNHTNEAINADGIELWGTLIQRYVYSDKNIEDQIFAKNLQEQTEYLNAALSALAEARAETEQMRALWDAKIKSLNVEGESKLKVIKSEAQKYELENMSLGDKLMQSALAEVELKRNSLYASPGGNIFVAREMLPLVSSLSGGIISGIDPFDISAWIKRLTSQSIEPQSQEVPKPQTKYRSGYVYSPPPNPVAESTSINKEENNEK